MYRRAPPVAHPERLHHAEPVELWSNDRVFDLKALRRMRATDDLPPLPPRRRPF